MIDNSKEYIACAAVHYDNNEHYHFHNSYGIDSGFVICGFRHPIIGQILPFNHFADGYDENALWLNVDVKQNHIKDGNPIYDRVNITQGFMTSLGRFVGRKEGAEIALACGQITKLISPPNLYSEDIFPKQAIRSEL